MNADRAALRAPLRARRDALPPQERFAAADALHERLQDLPEILTDERIAGYWAVRGELSLHRLVADIERRGQTYHLPTLGDGGALRFAPWTRESPMIANRFGIPEVDCAPEAFVGPEALQLVFVPLVAFDRRGHRLGSGAGYYDRSFAFLRAGERPREPLLVGIAYAFQELDTVAAEPWDVPLDFVCTDRELIECQR